MTEPEKNDRNNSKNGDDKVVLPMGKKRLFRLPLIIIILLAGLAWAFQHVMEYLKQEDFLYSLYEHRQEYLFIHSMSSWKKWFLVNTPFLADSARKALKTNLKSHTSVSEYYNPEQHNNEYRKVLTDIITKDECVQIQDILLNNSPNHGGLERNEVDVVNTEFYHKSVVELLRQENDADGGNVTLADKKLLLKILSKVQLAIEEAFDSPYMVMDYADITMRQNPVSSSSGRLEKIRYATTGGHKIHADQCGTYNTPQVYRNGFVCEIMQPHCCAHRTHSGLLYLNLPNDQSLQGGDIYLVNRHDLLDPSQPSYSGVGYSKQLQHTLRVKPTCGTLVMFASDARNLHGTFPIVKGKRFAMPMWFTSLPDVPWHEEEVLEHHLENMFWPYLQQECEGMQVGQFPVPTGLKEYIGRDCNEMVEAVEHIMYQGEDEDSEEE